MRRLRLAVIGWGQLGQACAAALRDSPDLALAGVVRRAESLAVSQLRPGRDMACVSHVSELGGIDAALLCVPTEAAPGAARELLQAGLPLVECASFEGDALRDHCEDLARIAARRRVAAVVGAGWDPGVLAQLQLLFERLIPKGHSSVTRHVAAGLHHTAAAEGVAGVRGALTVQRAARPGRRLAPLRLCGAGPWYRPRARAPADRGRPAVRR
ncbi:hypothetical protein [Piscinibacter sp.]|uniref:hypothetical protein n=1 Tax=Piscinibacter sp. TaxID=1903157 RepID=UPI00355AAABF